MVDEEDIIRRRILLFEIDKTVVVYEDAPDQGFWEQVEGLHERRHSFDQIDQLVFGILKFMPIDIDQFPVAFEAKGDQQE